MIMDLSYLTDHEKGLEGLEGRANVWKHETSLGDVAKEFLRNLSIATILTPWLAGCGSSDKLTPMDELVEIGVIEIGDNNYKISIDGNVTVIQAEIIDKDKKNSSFKDKVYKASADLHNEFMRPSDDFSNDLYVKDVFSKIILRDTLTDGIQKNDSAYFIDLNNFHVRELVIGKNSYTNAKYHHGDRLKIEPNRDVFERHLIHNKDVLELNQRNPKEHIVIYHRRGPSQQYNGNR
jgi:hypothetical protein